MELFCKFLNKIKDKKVLVCGMGRSNLFLIKELYKFGVNLFLYDGKEESKIDSEIFSYVKTNNINYRFGEDSIEGIDCDLIIRTPGMNYFSDDLVRARQNGIIVTSEMEIFFNLCPCKIIGITGSDGKTTTTTIISEILKNSGKKVFVGGNIGQPLLPKLQEITEGDIVIAELSSFQLISVRRSPDISVITNLSPNHLDVHKDMQEYTDAKQNIISHQDAFGRAVLNFDDRICQSMSSIARGQTVFFSRKNKVNFGSWMDENGQIFFTFRGKDNLVMAKKDIKLVGDHNLENYLAAISAVWGIADVASIKKTARKFGGVEHRLEFVRELNRVSYYNDSIATSPTRVIKGCLSVFNKKIILIAGGYDKKVPFDELGEIIPEKVKVLILTGLSSDKIEDAVVKSSKYNPQNPIIIKVQDLQSAVQEAFKHAKAGDVVALSPACASFDTYKNFEERGNQFKKFVKILCEDRDISV